MALNNILNFEDTIAVPFESGSSKNCVKPKRSRKQQTSVQQHSVVTMPDSIPEIEEYVPSPSEQQQQQQQQPVSEYTPTPPAHQPSPPPLPPKKNSKSKKHLVRSNSTVKRKLEFDNFDDSSSSRVIDKKLKKMVADRKQVGIVYKATNMLSVSKKVDKFEFFKLIQCIENVNVNPIQLDAQEFEIDSYLKHAWNTLLLVKSKPSTSSALNEEKQFFDMELPSYYSSINIQSCRLLILYDNFSQNNITSNLHVPMIRQRLARAGGMLIPLRGNTRTDGCQHNFVCKYVLPRIVHSSAAARDGPLRIMMILREDTFVNSNLKLDNILFSQVKIEHLTIDEINKE